MIGVEVVNVNPTRMLEYKSWSGSYLGISGSSGSLRDNFGNTYQIVTFRNGAWPTGTIDGRTDLPPDRIVSDLLVFEVPLKAAESIDLDLSASNFGESGTVRFRIPASIVGGSGYQGKPVGLELPPGPDLPENDPKDARPLVVRKVDRARTTAATMRQWPNRESLPPSQPDQLADVLAKWKLETSRTAAAVTAAKNEAIRHAKTKLQTEAEAKFPASKTDLKLRARGPRLNRRNSSTSGLSRFACKSTASTNSTDRLASPSRSRIPGLRQTLRHGIVGVEDLSAMKTAELRSNVTPVMSEVRKALATRLLKVAEMVAEEHRRRLARHPQSSSLRQLKPGRRVSLKPDRQGNQCRSHRSRVRRRHHLRSQRSRRSRSFGFSCRDARRESQSARHGRHGPFHAFPD
ncbi:hypothetical protein [Zavarzinella formosa]|uniref:hypothetical protein n=1 Tax=Zavarzinella formosa TaxID=360055 RepID=UPI000372DA99|nr:hypothetical protein [Zavarzinella formosa]